MRDLGSLDEVLPEQVPDGIRGPVATVAAATLRRKGDTVSHFATLRTMRENLASMGHSPSEDNFYAVVIGSLPLSYDPYVSLP